MPACIWPRNDSFQHPRCPSQCPIRDALPASVRGARVYPKDLPLELRDEVWRLFRLATEPLHEAGKLGVVLLQFPPWVRPAPHTPAMLTRVREQLGNLPVAVEF